MILDYWENYGQNILFSQTYHKSETYCDFSQE